MYECIFFQGFRTPVSGAFFSVPVVMYGMGKQSTGACSYWIQLCLDRGCRIQLAPIPQDMGVKQKSLCLPDMSFHQWSST